MRRSWRVSIGIGILVGIAVGLGIIAVVAVPLYGLAQATEPEAGLDRPFVRTGLTRVALPAGAAGGVVAGGLSARAARRGWKLPSPR